MLQFERGELFISRTVGRNAAFDWEQLDNSSLSLLWIQLESMYEKRMQP